MLGGVFLCISRLVMVRIKKSVVMEWIRMMIWMIRMQEWMMIRKMKMRMKVVWVESVISMVSMVPVIRIGSGETGRSELTRLSKG